MANTKQRQAIGRSVKRPQGEPTREDYRRKAARLGIDGRSQMSKDELRRSVAMWS